MVNKRINHNCIEEKKSNGEWQVTCSCGAVWSQKKDSTFDERKSIYESHLKYFNRPKMETL